MDRKIINENFSVSGQISIDDIDTLKTAGVKTIICNRPDNEDLGQPEVDTIKTAAETAGLDFYFLPVISGQLSPQQGEAMSSILKQSQQPVHAYCRSGTRCTILWAMTRLMAGDDKQTVISQAGNAGYDLTNVFS